VYDDDTVDSLHERIKRVEHRLLPRAVEELLCAR
jgi:folate-dependent phosphoribosylglycinamide formyltransferase PurN